MFVFKNLLGIRCYSQQSCENRQFNVFCHAFLLSATGFFIFSTEVPLHHSHSQANPLILTTINSSHLFTTLVCKATPALPRPFARLSVCPEQQSRLLFPDRLTCCRPCQLLFLPPVSPWVMYTLHVFPLQGEEFFFFFFLSRGISVLFLFE